MKSYDDLQRFKEKTQTNHIEFKDMSEQTKNSDSANWAIIRQLMNDGAAPTLGNGQSVDVAAPQPVAEDAFSRPSTITRSGSVTPSTTPPDTKVAAFVAAKPVTGGQSLLESISASLKPASSLPQAAKAPGEMAPQPEKTADRPAPARPASAVQPGETLLEQLSAQHAADQRPATAQADSLSATESPQAGHQNIFSQLKAAPAPFAARLAPEVAAQQQKAAETPRFKPLFNSAPEALSPSLSKDTPLQSLLEKIASCR